MLVASLAVAGCRSAALVPLATSPEGGTAARSSERVGNLRLSIRWPERRTQYIPAGTAAIDFKVFRSDSTVPIAVRTVNNPQVGGTSTVDFPGLAAGDIVVTGSARDANGVTVSAGSVKLTIVANQTAQAHLVLVSTEQPRIISFWPTAADPGTDINVFGGGFGASRAATFSLKIGGASVPASALSRVDDSLLSFKVPEGATNSVITLLVENKATESLTPFTTVRSWTMDAATADLFVPNGVQTFSAVAHDYRGTAVFNPAATWALLSPQGSTGSLKPFTDPDAVTGDPTIQARLIVGESLGDYRVVLGHGSATVQAVVSTHALTFADVSDRLGPLPKVVEPADNPGTPAKIALGHELFFDTRTGSNGAMACATCHLPTLGWTDGLDRSIGNDGLRLPRNAPTILNAGRHPGPFFWDGRAVSLEDQVKGVFGSTRELHRTDTELTNYLTSAGYTASFSAVFGTGPNLDTTAKAIAAFERTVNTGDSAFDHWAKGDDSALSAQQKRGLAVYATVGRCIQCHNGPMFTDEKFHNIAIFEPGLVLSPGRFDISGISGDFGAFKTPTLRNVAETAPYFHNGPSKTLEEAILHYEGDFGDIQNIDPLLATSIQLTNSQRSDLASFLGALSGATPSIQP